MGAGTCGTRSPPAGCVRAATASGPRPSAPPVTAGRHTRRGTARRSCASTRRLRACSQRSRAAVLRDAYQASGNDSCIFGPFGPAWTRRPSSASRICLRNPRSCCRLRSRRRTRPCSASPEKPASLAKSLSVGARDGTSGLTPRELSQVARKCSNRCRTPYTRSSATQHPKPNRRSSVTLGPRRQMRALLAPARGATPGRSPRSLRLPPGQILPGDRREA